MGACCSKNEKHKGSREVEGEAYDDIQEDDTCEGDCGARVRLHGSSIYASMFTQKGRKGINQDAMTIWEDFTGEKEKIFCGVFDGHGPSGHKVAFRVRDVLPSKLSSLMKPWMLDDSNHDGVDFNLDNDGSDCVDDTLDNNDSYYPTFSSWKANLIKAFKETDKELSLDSTIDSFCSGATAVTILKQGEHLIIANLGDSRAILGTRNDKNQPVPVQLTVDLKPNLSCEAERIINCKGRVFAMEQEPDVYRLWMPNENCPGLAMARAFGDFCLKDFGLISIPQVSYRKLTSRDEFVVLATDGVWDVLSNKEVVKIVASARKRSIAAQLLVNHAVQAWRSRYPTSKVDDCAVICLFLNLPSSSSRPNTGFSEDSRSRRQLTISQGAKTVNSDKRPETVQATMTGPSKEQWNALEGVSRVNSIVKLPRSSSDISWRKRWIRDEEY